LYFAEAKPILPLLSVIQSQRKSISKATKALAEFSGAIGRLDRHLREFMVMTKEFNRLVKRYNYDEIVGLKDIALCITAAASELNRYFRKEETEMREVGEVS